MSLPEDQYNQDDLVTIAAKVLEAWDAMAMAGLDDYGGQGPLYPNDRVEMDAAVAGLRAWFHREDDESWDKAHD